MKGTTNSSLGLYVGYASSRLSLNIYINILVIYSHLHK